MKIKHKAPSGRIYQIETYAVGQAFGVSARVRRGAWSQVIDRTFGAGAHDAAAACAERLADKHDAAICEVAR
jgi:hypothetical protein